MLVYLLLNLLHDMTQYNIQLIDISRCSCSPFWTTSKVGVAFMGHVRIFKYFMQNENICQICISLTEHTIF